MICLYGVDFLTDFFLVSDWMMYGIKSPNCHQMDEEIKTYNRETKNKTQQKQNWSLSFE